MTWKVVAAFGVGAVAGLAAAWCLLDAQSAGVVDRPAEVGNATSRVTPPLPPGHRTERRPTAAPTGTDVRSADAGDQTPTEAATAGSGEPTAAETSVAAELLALVTAEARSPSPPRDGLRAYRLAQEFAGQATGLRVDLDLVRMLFAGPGHTPQAGRTLLRLVEPAIAVVELRRLLARGQAERWRGALPGEVEASLASVARDLFSEDELRSMFSSATAQIRETAFVLLVRGHHVGADELLRLARSDPSHNIRGTSLDALVAGMATGRSDRAVVTSEVLRVARDRDDPLQEKAIDALGEFGPEGTQLAVELITSGAVPPALVGSLAQTIVRAGRTDELVRAPANGESLRRMVDALEEAAYDQAETVDVVAIARVLRSFPLPEDAETAETLLRVAIATGASDMVLDAAQRRDVPQRVRLIAAAALLSAEPPRPTSEWLAAAASILEGAPVDAVRRREFLENRGMDLVDGSPAGRDLVTRLANDDPDPWVRHQAAQLVRDAH
jgi:hypothetical protein